MKIFGNGHNLLRGRHPNKRNATQLIGEKSTKKQTPYQTKYDICFALFLLSNNHHAIKRLLMTTCLIHYFKITMNQCLNSKRSLLEFCSYMICIILFPFTIL